MYLRFILLFCIFQSALYASSVAETSIERGAQFFQQYCAGCHALKYLAFDKTQKYQHFSKISLPDEDATRWFGRSPPDLSLTVRERGKDWIYHYLTGFYADASRPFGTNNALVANVSMPNVLYPLNDLQLTQDLHDVIAFLSYVAEPAKTERYHIGLGVMFFLFLFGYLVYRLKMW